MLGYPQSLTTTPEQLAALCRAIAIARKTPTRAVVVPVKTKGAA